VPSIATRDQDSSRPDVRFASRPAVVRRWSTVRGCRSAGFAGRTRRLPYDRGVVVEQRAGHAARKDRADALQRDQRVGFQARVPVGGAPWAAKRRSMACRRRITDSRSSSIRIDEGVPRLVVRAMPRSYSKSTQPKLEMIWYSS